MSQIILPDMPFESMVKIRNARIYDLEESIAASKYPMQIDPDPNDTGIISRTYALGGCEPGTGHDNFLCGIRVAFDIDLTAKCLIEEERYHFSDIVSCNSTMHRITKFDLDKAYCKYVDHVMIERMKVLVADYNLNARTPEKYLTILYSNPCGFIYTMRINTNYRQLKTWHIQRHNHRIPEWREICKWIEGLPYSELFLRKD